MSEKALQFYVWVAELGVVRVALLGCEWSVLYNCGCEWFAWLQVGKSLNFGVQGEQVWKKNGKYNSWKFKLKEENSQSKTDQTNNGCFICDRPHRAKNCPNCEATIVDNKSRKRSNSTIIRVNPLQLLNAICVEKTILTRRSASSGGCGLLEPESFESDMGWCAVVPCTHATSNDKCMREACLDNVANVQDSDALKQMQGRSRAMLECGIMWDVNKESQSWLGRGSLDCTMIVKTR